MLESPAQAGMKACARLRLLIGVWAVCFSTTVLVHTMTVARVQPPTVSSWSLHSRKSQTTGDGRTAPSPTSVISSGVSLLCCCYAPVIPKVTHGADSK